MTFPAISGSGDVNSAAWNAIATIKANSPFSTGASSSSNVADEFDSLIDHSAADTSGGVSSSSAGSGSTASTGSASSLAMLRQIQNAQQSTIDLFA